MIYKKNARIIIIDDEKEICEMIKTVLLQEDKFDIITYIDSEKFVEDYKNYDNDNLDLVIIDLMMPKFDGFQILELLNSRENTRFIPKVVMSAFQSRENISEVYKYGAIQFIEKPIYLENLIYQIKTLLRIKLYEDNNRCIIDLLKEKNKQIADEIDKKNQFIGNANINKIENNLETISRLIHVSHSILKSFDSIMNNKFPQIIKSEEYKVLNEVLNTLENLDEKRNILDRISDFLKKNSDMF